MPSPRNKSSKGSPSPERSKKSRSRSRSDEDTGRGAGTSSQKGTSSKARATGNRRETRSSSRSSSRSPPRKSPSRPGPSRVASHTPSPFHTTRGQLHQPEHHESKAASNRSSRSGTRRAASVTAGGDEGAAQQVVDPIENSNSFKSTKAYKAVHGASEHWRPLKGCTTMAEEGLKRQTKENTMHNRQPGGSTATSKASPTRRHASGHCPNSILRHDSSPDTSPKRSPDRKSRNVHFSDSPDKQA